jgi:hypothetical protein
MKTTQPAQPEQASTDDDNVVNLAAADPFADLSKLRLSQNFTETAGVKKLLTSVPVRKPKKFDFNRVHPSAEYRGDFALIELKDESETYLVTPEIAVEIPGEFFMATVYTAINRLGTVFLWPVRLPSPDGKTMEWHRSAAEAAALAIEGWVRVVANRDLGAYDIIPAKVDIPDPVWPEEPYRELLRIGFRDRLISTFNHPLLKRIRGE